MDSVATTHVSLFLLALVPCQHDFTSPDAGDSGNIFVFRTLLGGKIRFQFQPSPRSNVDIQLYNNTIDVATSTLGTPRLLYTFTNS